MICFDLFQLWNDAHAAEQVVPALQQSLQRLHQTHVDLYLIHWPFATEVAFFLLFLLRNVSDEAATLQIYRFA